MCPKECFGEPFRSHFEVSAESENEAPVWTPAPFSRFLGRQKSDRFLRYFRKGLRLKVAAVSVLTDECDPENLKAVDISEIIEIAAKAEPKMITLFKELIKML